MFDKWILGKNARNLVYIKKFNPRRIIRLADNKLKTKSFLKERWIPVPETYWVLKSRKELFDFDFSQLEKKNFVVKPNKWSKGEWIYVVKFLDDKDMEKENIPPKEKEWFFDNFLRFWASSKFDHYYKIQDQIISDDVFRRYLTDVLDGKHSMTLGQDKVLIEEKLKPWKNFKRYCRHGLADIRVIVFNLIPVAAMIRVPTLESWGKANIARGGIGFGIEVGSWKIKSMYYKKQIFTNSFPGEYEENYDKKITFWDEVLLYSSKIQYFVNLGYLALDWVITDDGPKLLEINSRAGLDVQLASNLPMKKRLNKVMDISVKDPEKWVEIAKSLFTKAKSSLIEQSKVLYLSQKWNLIIEWEEEDETIPLNIKIDWNKDKNYISSNLYSKIKETESDVILDLYENDIRFKNIAFTPSDNVSKDEIVLWQSLVSDFYIKPIHKIQTKINLINPKNVYEEELEKLSALDQNVHKTFQKMNLSNILTPTNYLDELDNFVTWWWNYNPKFVYQWPEKDYLNEIRDQLLYIQDNYLDENFGLKSNFAKLYEEKIKEWLIKVDMIKAYKKQKFDEIFECNKAMFGDIDQELLDLAKNKIFFEESSDPELLGKKLSFSQTKKIIKNYLHQKWISWVKIITWPFSLARISIVKWNKLKIKLAPWVEFREYELYSTLAHEIDVHLLRYLNWAKTPWNLLKSWTGFYLKDEEGYAVYKSMEALPEQAQRKSVYNKYYFAAMAQKYSFSRLADIVKGIDPHKNLERIFKTAFRFKKWVKNTGFVDQGAVYLKDKIYLDGYSKINNYIDEWNDIEDFMIWKIKIEDIDKIL